MAKESLYLTPEQAAMVDARAAQARADGEVRAAERETRISKIQQELKPGEAKGVAKGFGRGDDRQTAYDREQALAPDQVKQGPIEQRFVKQSADRELARATVAAAKVEAWDRHAEFIERTERQAKASNMKAEATVAALTDAQQTLDRNPDADPRTVFLELYAEKMDGVHVMHEANGGKQTNEFKAKLSAAAAVGRAGETFARESAREVEHNAGSQATLDQTALATQAQPDQQQLLDDRAQQLDDREQAQQVKELELNEREQQINERSRPWDVALEEKRRVRINDAQQQLVADDAMEKGGDTVTWTVRPEAERAEQKRMDLLRDGLIESHQRELARPLDAGSDPDRDAAARARTETSLNAALKDQQREDRRAACEQELDHEQEQMQQLDNEAERDEREQMQEQAPAQQEAEKMPAAPREAQRPTQAPPTQAPAKAQAPSIDKPAATNSAAEKVAAERHSPVATKKPPLKPSERLAALIRSQSNEKGKDSSLGR